MHGPIIEGIKWGGLIVEVHGPIIEGIKWGGLTVEVYGPIIEGIRNYKQTIYLPLN